MKRTAWRLVALATLLLPGVSCKVWSSAHVAGGELVTPSPLPPGAPFAAPTVPPASPEPEAHAQNAVAFITGDWKTHQPDSLWIAPLDGTGETWLLDRVYKVAWSPDGRWLGCVRDDGLWVISADAEKQTLLLPRDPGKGEILRLAWSPDSTRIAFILGKHDGRYLGVVEVESKKVAYLVENSLVMHTVLEWSPDGRMLAYLPMPHFRITDTATGTSRDVYGPPGCRGTYHLFAWFPSGDRIAFLSFGNGRYARGTACVCTLSGDCELPAYHVHNSNPVWAPDGRGIYLVTQDTCSDDPNLEQETQLLYFPLSGQPGERLASMVSGWFSDVEALTLSPDGRWLAFLVRRLSEVFVQFFNLADHRLLTFKVDLPGEFLHSGPRLYEWAADSQHVVLIGGHHHTPDTVGIRLYGALYAFNFLTGEWRRLTGEHWIKQFDTSPPRE